ncbi:MAG: tyrosine-type recombinase/integrase [Gemmatimonadota bacterium]
MLSRDEVRRVLRDMHGTQRLVTTLLYGSGLRLLEALALRVKDIAIERREIRVRRGKGGHDRVALLPDALRPDIVKQIRAVGRQHGEDVRRGAGYGTP